MFYLFLLIYVAQCKDDFMAPPPRPPPMPPSVKAQLIRNQNRPLYQMQASRFLPRLPGTAVVEKKSDRRVSKSRTDERPIIAPNVQVTTANNKSVKHETVDALQGALITQKADFERKLFDANCRIKELEALLRGAKNRYRDCRENSRKNHVLFTEVVSTNFSKLFTLMELSGIGGDGVD